MKFDLSPEISMNGFNPKSTTSTAPRSGPAPAMAPTTAMAWACLVAACLLGASGCFVDPRQCADDSECFAGEQCRIASGAQTGTCVVDPTEDADTTGATDAADTGIDTVRDSGSSDSGGFDTTNIDTMPGDANGDSGSETGALDTRSGDTTADADGGGIDGGDGGGDASDICQPTGPETCDGRDNDCDDMVDEPIPCGPKTDEGICQIGNKFCNGGTRTMCLQAVYPEPSESCDGKDNDCDGMVDENLTRKCGNGKGICTQGTETCTSGSWGTCSGGSGPAPEACNGVDLDCNGLIDDGGVCHYNAQLGSSSGDTDQIFDAADIGGGQVVVVGMTKDALGQTNPGGEDAFVAVYGRRGRQQWIRQFGTNAKDWAYGVELTSKGLIVVVGETEGHFSGQSNPGDNDAFVAVFDPAQSSQKRVDLMQFGSAKKDEARDVVATGPNTVAVVGSAGEKFMNTGHNKEDDVFVKFFTVSPLQSTKDFQFGSPSTDRGLAVAAKAGTVYVTGETDGSLDRILNSGNRGQSKDAFVAKLTKSGGLQWSRNIGNIKDDPDLGYAVTVDAAGDIYVGGRTGGPFGGGSYRGKKDGWVAKFSAGGARQWVRFLATKEDEVVRSLAAPAPNVITAAGWTKGDLAQQGLIQKKDLFRVELDAAGTQTDSDTWGTKKDEELAAHVPVVGPDVVLVGSIVDSEDGFLMRVAP